MTDWDYHAEPIIGHHVSARIVDPTELSKQLDDVAEELGIDRNKHQRVEIEIGDVDWDEPKRIRVRKEVLEDIVEQL